jgi:hypothetical protein
MPKVFFLLLQEQNNTSTKQYLTTRCKCNGFVLIGVD